MQSGYFSGCLYLICLEILWLPWKFSDCFNCLWLSQCFIQCHPINLSPSISNTFPAYKNFPGSLYSYLLICQQYVLFVLRNQVVPFKLVWLEGGALNCDDLAAEIRGRQDRGRTEGKEEVIDRTQPPAWISNLALLKLLWSSVEERWIMILSDGAPCHINASYQT